MAKKMFRNSFFVRLGAAAACAAASLAGCATGGDGDGSETHFLCSADPDCATLGAGYRCVDRQCSTRSGRDAGTSDGGGASGSGGCANETRSTPYSAGMVVTGQAGVTVALTSNPAPPTVGDNTWTFTVKDPGGALLPGATIAVTQFMPDHRHAGSKAVVVTDLGGGWYRAAPVNFSMDGYWETTLFVKKAPIDDSVVIKLCVQQ